MSSRIDLRRFPSVSRASVRLSVLFAWMLPILGMGNGCGDDDGTHRPDTADMGEGGVPFGNTASGSASSEDSPAGTDEPGSGGSNPPEAGGDWPAPSDPAPSGFDASTGGGSIFD